MTRIEKYWLMVGPPLLAFLLSFVAISIGTSLEGRDFFDVMEYSRWDSENYIAIAKNGHTLRECLLSETGEKIHCAGTSAWLPLYSFFIRAGLWTGLSGEVVGFLISNFFFFGILFLLWNVFLNVKSDSKKFLLLLIAAFFPGSIYYQAIFPLSTYLFFALLCLYALSKHKFFLSGIAGFFATMSHSTGLFIAVPVAFSILTDSALSVKKKITGGYDALSPMLLAFLFSILLSGIETGEPKAFFLNRASFGHEFTYPFHLLWILVRPVVSSAQVADVTHYQALFIFFLVILVSVFLYLHFGKSDRLEKSAYLHTLVFWIMPMSVGGMVSFTRCDAFLLPIVLLMRRVPNGVLLLIVLVSLILKIGLTTHFLRGTLI